ncbi:MAG TPA: efflux RND transporter periplasmic adaptor subunit [Bryobacteraceae bacterium]|nr:efflux RND transporter periplasmic adaptor subunit [Bryobacteraceae bacterium]
MIDRRKCFLLAGAAGMLAVALCSCSTGEKASAANNGTEVSEAVAVGVTQVGRATLVRRLTQSSELVPFQEIDVYAKESGYVKTLNVDYGSRVKAGDVMAVLEIPELQEQLAQDDAAIRNAQEMIAHAENELNRREANAKVLHLAYDRLSSVAKSKPGLVAQQEVDNAEGADLAAQAQVEATKSTLQSAQSVLEQAKAKRAHDQVLFDYTKITAPFAGVVTERYANYGTLLQAGTSSSTQALPLVRLSEDDLFRLVIPVPESFVRFIHIGDPVEVSVPSLNKKFPGKVARFSVDVREDTRTMHTEVDVPNPNRVLVPGLYADATITLERIPNALAVPLQAIDRNGDNTTVDVVTPDNKIEIRQVELGIQTENQAEVLSGLKEGDSVVVSDRSGLKAGQTVRPKQVELIEYRAPSK